MPFLECGLGLAIAELMRYLSNIAREKRSSDCTACPRFSKSLLSFFSCSNLLLVEDFRDGLALPTLAHTLWLTTRDCAI
jgi:hypothetical protein